MCSIEVYLPSSIRLRQPEQKDQIKTICSSLAKKHLNELISKDVRIIVYLENLS